LVSVVVPDTNSVVERRPWIVVTGLSILGAVGVARGVARDDVVLVGLWVIYLLLAGVFTYRTVK
jgi:hypothetical protein